MLTDLEESEPSEERDKSRFYRATFEQILGQLGIGANLETHVVERLRSEDRVDQRNLKALLLDMGRTITGTIFDGWNRIFGRAPAAQEVELAADTGDDGSAFLELKIKGPDGHYDLSERSLGFRWFFMFLLMTSYRGLTNGARPTIFLLDEPASNLHSSAQAELLKSFENLAKSCHLVYTTHSHHLINLRWLDFAYVVKNDAMGALSLDEYLTSHLAAKTSISAKRYRQFVAEHPDQTSYYQPVLDLLEYRPSSLEPVPDVVLVEGKSDFFLLRYITEIVGIDPKLHYVPGGGAGALDPLIRLHIGWGKSFVVLLDGDAEGVKQRSRYEAEFGSLLVGRCLTLPEACGDVTVKEVEHLLGAADRSVMIDAVFPTDVARPTAKKALSQAIIELYARRALVDIEKPTLTRFGTLISALAESLASQLRAD